MTGDGLSGQPLGCQPFSLQPPETGCQLPMAERPIPELPMPVPVTRHLNRCSFLVHRTSGPLVSLPMSPCQHAPSRRCRVPSCDVSRRKLDPNHHHDPLTDLIRFDAENPAFLVRRPPGVGNSDLAGLLIVTNDHTDMAVVAIRNQGLLPFT